MAAPQSNPSDTATPQYNPPEMATPQYHPSDSNDGTLNMNNEKIDIPKDEDSSSGHIEAALPSADRMVVDRATERAVLRKLDYRIVPMVMWVYLMNMMDRGKYSVIAFDNSKWTRLTSLAF